MLDNQKTVLDQLKGYDEQPTEKSINKNMLSHLNRIFLATEFNRKDRIDQNLTIDYSRGDDETSQKRDYFDRS